VVGKLWCKTTGALVKFGIFSWILVNVWSGLGPNHNYFSETEGHTAILPTHRDRGTIYKNLRAYSQKGKEYGFS
jgi:hypothetical protein